MKFLGHRDFGTERVALFDVKMGGGKTRMIQGALLRGYRSLILTHIQTLAAYRYHEVHKPQFWDEMDDTLDRYTKPQLKHYNNNFATRESKATMGAANQLICQLEIIGLLAWTPPYKYLMIDESQLLFAQAASSYLPSSEVRKMWEVPTRLIKTAKYIQSLDGFMGKRSLHVLKGLGIRNVAVVRIPRRCMATITGGDEHHDAPEGDRL